MKIQHESTKKYLIENHNLPKYFVEHEGNYIIKFFNTLTFC